MRQVFLASSALVVVASSAQAQTLTWDPSGTAGVQGGAGTWQGPAGNTNWTDTGGATNRAWANDASAVFGTAGGTVTVDTSGGAVSFGGMTFNSSGYTISGNALTVASGGATISSSGIDATINSRLTGNGALTISNTVGGIISLTNNANDYSGGTVLSFARVGVGANNVFGSGSISASDALFISLVDGLTISNSVSLGGLQVRIDTGAFETEYSGQLAGATRITKLGSGTLVLSNATNSIPGGFDLGAGTIATTSAAALGSGPILIESGATLQARGSMTLANTFSLGSGAVFDTQANTMTLNGVLQNSLGVGSLVKNGTGTLSLTNTNTYSGGTTINAGVIEANHVTGVYIDALGTGAVTFNGGTLRNMAVDDRLANNIVLGAGGGTIDNSTGGFITLEGNITGSGNFTKTGSAVVRVQGVNDYSGATLVSAGSLRASSSTGFSANSAYTLAAGTSLELAGNSNSIGSLAGAGTVTNNGLAATLTVGANNSSTEFSGALTDGFSSVSRTALTKIGTGTLTLSGASSATGLVTVNAGTLNIAAGGSIAAGTEVNGGLLTVNGTAASVTVNSGGTLGGTGTVGTTAINGGTLAPGNSIGTISVAGNLGFTSASIYAVEVSPSAADRTNATGTATLAGTVNAQFAAGSYLTKSYTILSAAGGRSGTFNTLTTSNLPSGFTAALLYSGTDVILQLTGQLNAPGQNRNQSNVQTALNNFFNNGGALPPAFQNVFGLSGSALNTGLSQLSGEAATGAQSTSFLMLGQFLNLMLDPFVDGRGGFGAFAPAVPFAAESDSGFPPDVASAYAKVTGSKMPVKAPLQSSASPWTIWAGAYGAAADSDADAVTGSTARRSRVGGVAAGGDYRINPDSRIGFALSGAGGNWSLAQGLGGGSADSFLAGIYGVTGSGPLYAAGALSFGNHWVSTDRFSFATDRATAAFQAQTYGARAEAGYRLSSMFGRIAPYVAVQAISYRGEAYRENDVTGTGFALNVAAQRADEVRSELGARASATLTQGPGTYTVANARLAWAHNFSSAPTVAASFIALAGSNFTVTGAGPNRDAALVSAGLEWGIARGWTLAGKFDAEVGDTARSYGGRGTLRHVW